MSELEAGRVYVDLIPRLKQGFGAGLERELDGPLSRIKGKTAAIGKAFGIGLAGGAVAGGAILLKVGMDLDSALDTIQTKTGLTGKALESVQNSFRAVGKRVPDDLGKVADAVAMVSAKTGLTGKPLEDLSAHLLTLSRITGQDLATTIEDSNRTFGDWGIGVEDQASKLDFLFRASQKTGVSVSDLQQRLVKYGAPLRQLGFSFEESTAMIGKFQKEGVNTDLVLGSMRVALGKMAKAGEAPKETLARVTDEIKNAGTAGEANAIALELFGARAGPDMAAAIREGRFEIGSLTKEIADGKGTIEGSAAATDDFGEKLSKLKNRVILAAEPIAMKLFDGLNTLVDKALIPAGEWIGKRLPGAFDSFMEAIAPIVAAVKELFGIIFSGDFTGAGPFAEDSPWVDGAFRLRELFLEKILPAAKEFFGWISDHAKPIMAGLAAALALILGPFLVVGAALFAAYVKFEGFRNVVDGVAHWLTTNVPPAFETVRAAVAAAFEWLRVNVPPALETVRAAVALAFEWIQTNVIPIVQTVAAVIVAAFDAVVAWFRETWPTILEAIGVVIDSIRNIIETFIATALWAWETFGDELMGFVTTAWDFIRSTVENAINLVRSIIETVLALITGDWSGAWDGLKGIVSALWDQVVNIVSSAGKLVLVALEAVLSLLREAWDLAWEGMKDVLGGLWDGLTDAAKGALNAMLDALEAGINAAIDLLNTALDGIDKAAGPWVNFGEIPNVDLPALAKGGTSTGTGLAIVGDGGNGSGAELLAMPRGASVVPLDVARMIAAAALEGSGGDGVGVLFAEGAVQVDARGLQEPEEVGDIAARQIGWRTSRRGKR